MTNPKVSTTLLGGAGPKTDVEIGEILFGGDASLLSSYKPSLQGTINRLRDQTGMTAVESEALMLETSRFFEGAGIQSGEAQGLHSLIVSHLKRPPSDEMLNDWAAESRQRLRERYGDDADKKMEAVNKYVTAHPTLAKQLNESGTGSHPDVVLRLAERADRLRAGKK